MYQNTHKLRLQQALLIQRKSTEYKNITVLKIMVAVCLAYVMKNKWQIIELKIKFYTTPVDDPH